MRKHLLFILLTALCCNGLFAQDDEDGDDRRYRIAIGPKVGVGVGIGSHSTMENLSFSPALSYQAGLAFNAHFGRRYEMSDGGTGWLGLQVEAMYGGRNIRIDSTSMGTSCLEVPILAQLFVIPNLAIEAGVTMVKVFSGSPDQLTYEGATYGTGEIKGSDVMLSAGACYKAPFGLMIGARYNMSTSNLAGNFDTKISSLMLSVAYLFTIVK